MTDTRRPQDGSDITSQSIFTEVVEAQLDLDIDPEVFTDPNQDTVDELEYDPLPDEHANRYCWLLDNGHGAHSPRKSGMEFGSTHDGLVEYEFTRDIIRRILEALDEAEVEYYLLAPETDIDDATGERVSRANEYKSKLPKLLISVHANWAPRREDDGWQANERRGVETWFTIDDAKSRRLASVFQNHLVRFTKLKNRHLKGTRQFDVLRDTDMPAILTENGFYSHPVEAALLMTDNLRQRIANAHVAAILEVELKGL